MSHISGSSSHPFIKKDSADGDEKDAELEAEGCLTDPVTTPQQSSNWYYCLYFYQSSSVPEQSLGCYCCLVQQDKLQDRAGAAELTHRKITFMFKALSHSPVEVVGGEDKVRKDIDRFLNAASFQGLIHEDTTTATLCNALSEEPQKDVTIDCSQQQPQFLNAACCYLGCFAELVQASCFMLRVECRMRPLAWTSPVPVQAIPLPTAIQDLNNLKRLIQQAEMNHYALFRCYVFLKHCGNRDVLLQNVKVEHAEMPEAHKIVQVLEEFMYEEGSTSLQ
ncbi:UNVERIFIED_CONTAM: hypothetical protein FKN15_014332 [Acipenser sinensis]